MTDLPQPKNFDVGVSPGDIRAMMLGMTPGTYRTRDLYPRYKAWAEKHGRRVVSSKALGEAIGRMGVEKVGYAHGHVNVWDVREAWTR